MRLIFLGTAAWAVPCLRALAQAGYEIALVVTQVDRPAGRGRRLLPPPVKQAAQELDLPLFQSERINQPEAINQLKARAPDVLVACAFGQILKRPILELAPHGVLNVHPSLLPRHRGATPIQAAILSGDDTTGVSIMLMEEGLDSGPILSQRSLPIDPADTAASLGNKLALLAADLLLKTLPAWLAGELTPQAQDNSRSTVCHRLSKQDALIDWSLPAVDIWRRVRAFNPWPGTYTLLDGEMLHIWDAWPLAGDSGQPPGTVLVLSQRDKEELRQQGKAAGFAVQTGEGRLAVCNLQRPGRKSMPAAEFLRGAPGLIGVKLGERGD